MENTVKEYHGSLTREGIEEIINQGGSVLINDEVIDSIDKIPDNNKLYALALKGKVIVNERYDGKLPHINLFVSPVINNTFPDDYRSQTCRTSTTPRIETEIEKKAKEEGSTPIPTIPSTISKSLITTVQENVENTQPSKGTKENRWSHQNILLFTVTIGILILCALLIYMNYRVVPLPIQKIEFIAATTSTPVAPQISITPSVVPSINPTPTPPAQIVEKPVITNVQNIEKNIYSGSYRLEPTNNIQELMVFFDKKFTGTGYNVQFEVKTDESVRLGFKILDMIKYEDRIKLKLMTYGKFRNASLNVFAYE